MKIFAIVSALVASVFASAAVEARPDARSMTCKQLKVLVEDESVVVMDTGPQTFKRFVYHQGFCSTQESVIKA